MQAAPLNRHYPEIGIAVLTGLYDEVTVTETEWESLLGRTCETVKEAHGHSPELSTSEKAWFSAGMPDSPFALADFLREFPTGR